MSLQKFVPTPKLEEYSERFKDFFKFTRRGPRCCTAGS